MSRPVRLGSLDALRGLVIVLMCLDHVRDFFSNARFDPTDLDRTYPALFATRVVTHLCAPIFFVLAGASAHLRERAAETRGETTPADRTRELARYLATRGLFLVVMEVTWVRFGWTFDPTYRMTPLQVIWALGCSMIVLAGLVHLPRLAIGLFGAALVVGHHALDGVHVPGNPLYALLHEGMTSIPLGGGRTLFVVYPLIPWIGVMALSYAGGHVFEGEPVARRTRMARAGVAMLAAFALLRATGLYGDPRPFDPSGTTTRAAMSFLNVTKYPPSLQYLLLTLGVGALLLAALEQREGAVARLLRVYGVVPLFVYLVHLPLAHGLAGIVAYVRHGTAAFSFGPETLPSDYGFGLPGVYLATAVVLALLHPMCTAYAKLRKRRPDLWIVRYV